MYTSQGVLSADFNQLLFFRLLQHCAEFDDDKKRAVQYAYIDDVIKIKYFFDSLSDCTEMQRTNTKINSLMIFSFSFFPPAKPPLLPELNQVFRVRFSKNLKNFIVVHVVVDVGSCSSCK
jgi:hypothetical protein